MATILLLDDDISFLGTVREVLEEAGYQVKSATNGIDFMDMLADVPADLLVLDVVVPDINGIEVCRRVRADPFLFRLPILFLTGKGRTDDVVLGLETGADDYLQKPFDAKVLLARINALLRRASAGKLDASTQNLTLGSLVLNFNTLAVSVNGSVVALTPLEHRLLFCLMMRAGQPQSIDSLLEDVWGYAPGVGDPQLVRVHVAHLRKKLTLTPEHPHYIQTLHGHGYMIGS
jgi:DNA-binding response OmpR family regulator